MKKKRVTIDCKAKEYCYCNHNLASCEECSHYRMLDSGYGTCVALPQVEIVPWCRIGCGLWKGKCA